MPGDLAETHVNYLAHVLLSDDHPQSIIGNLSGDFVKGRLDGRFEPRIRRGIQLHRRVDSFTDQHPVVSELKALFSRERRRYAGIILDVSFDHYLSRHWQLFSDHGLRQFINRVYGILSDQEAQLPAALQKIAPKMISQDWLNSYGTLAGTGAILDRLATRISHQNPLPGAIAEVTNNYELIEEGFLALFPEVIQFVDDASRALEDADRTPSSDSGF